MPRAESLFEHLDETALRNLVPNGTVRSYRRNVVVVSEGDATNALYVVLSGRVRVFVSGEDGKEVVVNTIGAGDYFGELVLDGGARSASVMTLEPSRFYVIAHEDIEALLENNLAFARDLIRRLIGRVRDLTGKVTDLALKDNYGRFVKFVEDNAVDRGGMRVIPERLTQHDLAARISGSREMVSRILRDLTAGGYLSINAKQLIIHKKFPKKW